MDTPIDDRAKERRKAYESYDFLHSPDARILRIMAEYLGPLQRFQAEDTHQSVVMFGSARAPSPEEARSEGEGAASRASSPTRSPRYYNDARELSRRLTEWSRTLPKEEQFLVCSGGGPGIMEAANRGAADAGGRSIGLGISLPSEQFPNPYISPEFDFEFHYFFMRKWWFVTLALAFVVFPGGFGTMDELFELLTLLQTRKITRRVAVLIYGREYWQQVINFEAMVEHGTISPEDLDLFEFADTPGEAFGILRRRFEDYFGKTPVAARRLP